MPQPGTGVGGPELLRSDGSTRTYHVSLDGSTPYSDIESAITQAVADGLGPGARRDIYIHPGLYEPTTVIDVPGNVSVRGVSKGTARLRNATTNFFRCTGDNVFFEDLLFEGNGNVATWCIDGNNRDGIHIRRCDLLTNGGTALQGFYTQSGTTWFTGFIEDCVIDSDKTSGTVIFLENTGAAARFVDQIVNNVFIDMFDLTSAGSALRVLGCQDVRARNSTFRGSDDFSAVDLELAGVSGIPFVKVSHCWIGASPGINAGPGFTTVFGTSLEVYNCYWDKTLASIGGSLIETTPNFSGIGSWYYSADSTPDEVGEMYANNSTAASVTSLVFFHDTIEGARWRDAMESAGVGTRISLRNIESPGNVHTYSIDAVSSTATTITYTVTYTNGAGSGDLAAPPAWSVDLVPGPGFSVSGLTDNRVLRANGTNAIQGSALGLGDDGETEIVSGSTDPYFGMPERATAPASAAGFGRYWVTDDAPTRAGFTDDTGVDSVLGIQEIRICGTPDLGLTQNQWYSWSSLGWAHDSGWADAGSMGTGTGPDLSPNMWEHIGITFPFEGVGGYRILSVIINMYYASATASDVEFRLRGIVVADLVDTPTVESNHASLDQSFAAQAKQRVLTMTVDDPTITEDEKLYFCFRRTTATAVTADPRTEVIIRYAILA